MPPSKAYTVGAPAFNPDNLFDNSTVLEKVHDSLKMNDLHSAICKAFSIPFADRYTYHATVSVTLQQVQQAVTAGSSHGLHDWYPTSGGHGNGDEKAKDNVLQPGAHPDANDISAYILLFDPSKSAANILKGFKSNAKKGSIRSGVAEYLISRRHFDPSISISKRKQPHLNPYIDFWAWSCHSLEYAGPDQNTVDVKLSHHVLPVLMHHFGCACPSYESLELLKKAANGRIILDIGSGNGYWTLMLRRQGCEVIAIDNGQSKWRTSWIDDTVVADGIQFVKKRGGGNAKADVLLLVYPIVREEFTRNIIIAYQGDVISIVGTQNGNGYTGFKDQIADQWMKDERPDFEKVVQIPLPSFAGKDDALFIFQRKSAAVETT